MLYTLTPCTTTRPSHLSRKFKKKSRTFEHCEL